MVLMADYWLEHGMSGVDVMWSNLPYPYNTEVHSGEYDGDMRAGKGFLQPDKAASFGAELVVLYKMTGTRRYLDAAVAIANTLARKVKPGDGDNSPWPYRVNAATGEVHRQVKAGKTYVAADSHSDRRYRRCAHLSERDSRNAAISCPLRTSRTSPASTG